MTFCQTMNSVKLITKLFREHYDVLKSSKIAVNRKKLGRVRVLKWKW